MRYHEEKEWDREREKQGLNAVPFDNTWPIFFPESGTARCQQCLFRLCVGLRVRALKLTLRQQRKRPAVTWNAMEKRAKICTLLQIFTPRVPVASFRIYLFIFALPSAALLSAFIWHPLSFSERRWEGGVGEKTKGELGLLGQP